MGKAAKLLSHFKNPLFELSLKETNVLRVETCQEMVYEKEELHEIIDNIEFMAGGKKRLLLVVAGESAGISLEGMRVLAQPYAQAYAHAKAYVINTLAQRLMANFFMRYFKPTIPVKFFKKEKEAELWLLKNFRHLCTQAHESIRPDWIEAV